MTQAYPLQWPAAWPRTLHRKPAQFGKVSTDKGWGEKHKLSIADAVRRLHDEMDRLGARSVVLSTNVELRLDGLPRSDRTAPSDPGVALYFDLKGKPHCMPCDRWDRVADNIAAIAKHIEATRGIARWGVSSVEAMFTGFESLPPPMTWRKVLGFRPDSLPPVDEIERHFRVLAKEAHPDAGGSDAAMAEINRARADALAELRR